MNRATILVLGLIAVCLLGSCAFEKIVTGESLVTDRGSSRTTRSFASSSGQRVTGYVTRDSVGHAFASQAWIEGDSMVFDRPRRDRGIEAIQPAGRRRVALADLAWVYSEETDTGSTVAVILGLSVFVGILVLGGLYTTSFEWPTFNF